MHRYACLVDQSNPFLHPCLQKVVISRGFFCPPYPTYPLRRSCTRELEVHFISHACAALKLKRISIFLILFPIKARTLDSLLSLPVARIKIFYAPI